MSTIRLSLISHTNAGKTTLARTLLRRDVGEVRDAPHVTQQAEGHELIATAEGDVLELWDTPGFGDSVRLLRRLRQGDGALGWFLTQVWDRWTDRPFFSSQQALRTVRDATDLVLYLVNASEDPTAAAYVAAEMEILGWMRRPVLVLLNQLGPPQGPDVEAREVARWSSHLAATGWAREVLAIDAFARCWVQEQALFERIGAALPGDRRPAFERIAAAWRARNAETFARSMDVMAAQLARAALDHEEVSARSFTGATRSVLGDVWRALTGGESRRDPALEAAQSALAERLDASVRAATGQLITLHGLSGSAADEISERMGSAYRVEAAADPARASVIGGLLSGALGGLVADLAAGGLTFGAGAVIGGLLGMLGSPFVARAYNVVQGRESTGVRWSGDFLTGRVTSAVLRYLAVAHFGRGRGDFVQSEYPPHWRGVVERAVAEQRTLFEQAWTAASKGESATSIEPGLRAGFNAAATEVLRTLYPQKPEPT